MQGITKTFTITGTKGVTARVTVTEEYDIAANTSQLTVGVDLACSSYYGHTYYLSGTVSVGDQTLQVMDSHYGTHHVTVNRLDTYAAIAGNGHPGSPWTSQDILHETDGSKTVSVAVNLKGYETSGRGASGFSVNGSRSVELTHIPRASTALAADTAIGSVAIIAVSRKSTDYVHSIAYTFGDLSGYIAADGAVAEKEVLLTEVAVPFRIPEDFYGQIPNAPAASCELSCTTYLGDTQIGQAQHSTFTVAAAENLCRPLVSGQVRDENPDTVALTGDTQVLVQHMSRVVCTLTAQSRFGASILETAINGQPTETGTLTLPAAEYYRFTATDSRGYTGTFLQENTLIPYVPLTCQCTVSREDPTSGRGTLTVNGEAYAGTFGAVENHLELRCRVEDGDWLELVPQFQGYTYTAVATVTGLDYDRRTTVTVEAADCLMQQSASVTVEKGIPVFDWGEENFRFHVPVHLEGGVRYPGGEMPYVLAERQVNGHSLTDDVWLTFAELGAAPAQESAEYPGCFYRTVEGRTEWINPPMQFGEEYCTTARFCGLPVYCKLCDFGSLPNKSTKLVAHGIDGTVIGFRVFARNDSGIFQQFPFVNSSFSVAAKMHITNENMALVSGYTLSEYSAVVLLQYTKEGG